MGKGKEPGFRDLIAAIVRIADALDRIVQLLEDAADVVDLPVSDRRVAVEEIREG